MDEPRNVKLGVAVATAENGHSECSEEQLVQNAGIVGGFSPMAAESACVASLSGVMAIWVPRIQEPRVPQNACCGRERIGLSVMDI